MTRAIRLNALLLTAVSAGVLFAQPHTTPIAIDNGRLRVSLDGAPSGASYVLVFQPESHRSAAATFGDAIYGPPADCTGAGCNNLSALSAISPWPSDSAIVSPGRVSVLHLSHARGTFAALLRLPPGTLLSVTVNGSEIPLPPLGQGLILRDGVAYSKPVRGFGTLLRYLASPNSFE